MTSIASKYYILLRNQSYQRVAIFDSWQNLSYTKLLNNVDTYSLTLNAKDPRCSLFELDGMITVYRSIPALNVDWYEEFVGFHRKPLYDVSEKGVEIFVSSGVGLNDLLARTIINYKEGTIKAEKSGASETVIKEYVLENCGAEALVEPPYERQSYGVLPDFEVEASAGLGLNWEGVRAFENLLDTIQNIARLSDMDFGVTFDTVARKFYFKTYVEQFGEDRTTVGLNRATGLNSHGNTPVIFSNENGTVNTISHSYDRTNETNVVSVLGDGDGATREVQVRSTSAINDSPWNRREASRPQGGFISQMQAAGDEALADLGAKEIVSFVPLQQESQLYGKHYFFGDKITVSFRGIDYHKRIIGVTNNVDATDKPVITFSDY